MSAITKHIRRFMRQLLHGGAFSHGRAAQSQVYIVNAYSLLAFLTLVIFGLQHVITKGNVLLGYLEIIGGLTTLLNFLGLRLTGNTTLVRNNLLLIILGLLVVMLLTGGLAGTGLFWFFVFPASAFFLAGKRDGLIWMAALFFAIGLAVLFDHFHTVDIPYPEIVVRQLILSLLVVSAGTYAYQHARETLTLASHRSEESSKEEKIKSKTIVENIAEGVIAVDAAGTVVSINQSAEEMLGWGPQELLGRKFVEAVPMVDDKGNPLGIEERPLELALRMPQTITTQGAYVRKNGQSLPVAITSRSIVVNGKVRGAIGTLRDVTQERLIEHAKSEFVTLASHQLRTPISAIKWYSELLLTGDAGKLSDEQREYIQQVYGSNLRLAAIVDAMLTVSALELGSVTVRPELSNITALCRLQLADVLHMQPAKKELHITENYSEKLPKIPLDQAITKLILRSVLSNAIKYTPKGGNIDISVQPTTEKLSANSRGSVRITVKDTGYGIPQNQQKNIFVKLFRAANIKEKDTDGTGLGLYITKGLLEQVGGRISFTSREGAGSTFEILLPLEGMQPRSGADDSDIPTQAGVNYA
jgi:PAS domain S-box-containing protein